MKWISYSQIRTHICTFLRENSPERCIQSASEWRKHLYFSDDSSERLWLVIAFISSTESCVIGYNAQRCKNSADDRRAERSSHACVIVLNIENINRLFFVFWKLHSKSTWLKNLRYVPPHFEWAWRLWFRLFSRKCDFISHKPRLFLMYLSFYLTIQTFFFVNLILSHNFDFLFINLFISQFVLFSCNSKFISHNSKFISCNLDIFSHNSNVYDIIQTFFSQMWFYISQTKTFTGESQFISHNFDFNFINLSLYHNLSFFYLSLYLIIQFFLANLHLHLTINIFFLVNHSLFWLFLASLNLYHNFYSELWIFSQNCDIKSCDYLVFHGGNKLP